MPAATAEPKTVKPHDESRSRLVAAFEARQSAQWQVIDDPIRAHRQSEIDAAREVLARTEERARRLVEKRRARLHAVLMDVYNERAAMRREKEDREWEEAWNAAAAEAAGGVEE